MTEEFKEFKRTHPTKSLQEIIDDFNNGIDFEDPFGYYVNSVEARVS